MIENADHEVLKTLRLICKGFAGKSSQRLFEQVELSPFQDSYARLEGVAGTPQLSAFVMQIKLHCNIFETLDDQKNTSKKSVP